MSAYIEAMRAQAARFNRAARIARESGRVHDARVYSTHAVQAEMAANGVPTMETLADLCAVSVPTDGDDFPFSLGGC